MNIPHSANRIFSARAAHRQAVECASRYGLCFVAYGAIIRTIHGSQEVMINNYPDGWNDYYMDSGYKKCDPVIEHALSSCIHSIWTPHMFGRNILSRKMFHDVSESGIHCGITIPMRDHKGNVASVNFSGHSREPISFWEDMKIGYLYFIAANLHDNIVTGYLNEERLAGLPHITPRERDVLRFIADGKTAREIARTFRVTESAVEYHLKNIREKLSSSNTAQAVFKAAQMNLIDFASA